MLLHRGYTWLTLMPLLLSLSTGELISNFYRDALPETSEDIALKVARFLEAQRLQQRLGVQRSQLSPFLPVMHKYHMQKESDLLETLRAKFAMEKLRQQKLKTWRRHHQHPINEIIPERDLLRYYDLDLKFDYPEMKPNEDDGQGYKDLEYGYKEQEEDTSRRYGQASEIDKGIMEEPTMDFHMGYVDHNYSDMLHEGGREVVQTASVNEPKFTYKFDNSNLEEKHPFAVKPNDPRYYSDAPFSSDLNQATPEARWKKEKEEDEEERTLIKHEDNMRGINHKIPIDLSLTNEWEAEKSAVRHPLIVPMNHDLNSDIYFIAIVAGCSAAAMFALVLISLTWCRLQRGAKAAADIEYPAYGVTGPNKDVSPSGDQRLAQSAQMYHFQHQKQQIIAMENRTSATRDPGSLSEAESDEENEEGDYTVYECPGLASTGEMEVKNPMFHDDPTPATPAQSNNKEEDHI